jgi:hypothetical protein
MDSEFPLFYFECMEIDLPPHEQFVLEETVRAEGMTLVKALREEELDREMEKEKAGAMVIILNFN